jgi:hypothetical protein
MKSLFGVIHLTLKDYLLYKKTIRIMMVQNLEIHEDVLFKECFFVLHKNKLSLTNFLSNTLEYFLTNSAVYSTHTSHKYNNNSPFTMFSCFWTVLIVLESKFLSLPHNLKIIMDEHENFKTALKRHLNTHSFYLIDEF